jgi:DNA-binding PadR family transcriptional regulator
MADKSKPTTNAELAVLSLLAEQPMHGYQIEQTIELRGMREWTEIGFSSIYYILEKLRTRGCVESRLEPAKGKGPSRQVFSLSPAGRAVFRQAALNALASPSRSFSSFQLGLASLPMLGQKEILNALRSYKTMLKDKHAELAAKNAVLLPSLPWHVAGLFELDLAQLQCELDWLKEFIQTVESKSN